MFSVHTVLEEFKNATIASQFGFVFEDFEESPTRKITWLSGFPRFRKLRFQNVFRPHENKKPTFSNPSDLKSVFEKVRFRDGLVWTVGLAVEIKLRFQISPT